MSTNRIPLWEELDTESTETTYRVDQARITSCPSTDFATSMFMPLHYERNYAYPLIVWLHGEGDDESQLCRVIPCISMRNYVAVAPRGLHGRGLHGRGSQGDDGWPQTPESISKVEQRVLDCIELASHRYNIAEQWVFLAGYGVGGTMALRVALNLPRAFAGVASLGGPFPQGYSPLLNLGLARDLPLLLCHGRESLDYPVDEVCRDLRLIHTAGFSVTLRQYPTADELTPNMLGDLDSWIMPIVTGQPVSDDASEATQFTELN